MLPGMAKTGCNGSSGSCRAASQAEEAEGIVILNDTPEMRRKAYVAIDSAHLKYPDRCETCRQRKRLHKHHDDYAKPLAVRWLCSSCHVKLHVAIRKAAGTFKPGGRRKSRRVSA